MFRNETWFPIFHLYRSKIEENVFSSDDIKVFLTKKKSFHFRFGKPCILTCNCDQDCAAAKVMRRWYDDQVKKNWMDVLYFPNSALFFENASFKPHRSTTTTLTPTTPRAELGASVSMLNLDA